MARFEKTRIQWISSVLFLLTLYALAGLGYAAWMHSEESVVVWAIIAVGGLIASILYHQLVTKKKRPTP
jgi:hypothetical protein